MSINRIQHTRGQGKRLTYDIELTANSYTISLHGEILKQSGPIAGHFGDLSGADALIVHAKSDIENLSEMSEE